MYENASKIDRQISKSIHI